VGCSKRIGKPEIYTKFLWVIIKGKGHSGVVDGRIIKNGSRETEYEGTDWIVLACDKIHWLSSYFLEYNIFGIIIMLRCPLSCGILSFHSGGYEESYLLV
jgi:hypothetical protein